MAQWGGRTDGKHVISVIACGNVSVTSSSASSSFVVVTVCARPHTTQWIGLLSVQPIVGAAVSWASRKLTRFAGHVAPTMLVDRPTYIRRRYDAIRTNLLLLCSQLQQCSRTSFSAVAVTLSPFQRQVANYSICSGMLLRPCPTMH